MRYPPSVALRILSQGKGSRRPLVLVYHVAAGYDDAFRAALPPEVLLANDTETNQAYYTTVPPLATTKAQLEQTASCQLGPIVLAGFSAGGFATRTILAAGGDPDALVLADATYGTDVAPWQAYARRALAGQRVLFASYSSNVFMEPRAPSPWRNLRTITGLDLPLGAGPGVQPRPEGVPVITAPTRLARGQCVVYAYPDLDHGNQGHVVLPKVLLPGALGMLPKPGRAGLVIAGVVAAAAAATLAVIGYRSRSSRRGTRS